MKTNNMLPIIYNFFLREQFLKTAKNKQTIFHNTESAQFPSLGHLPFGDQQRNMFMTERVLYIFYLMQFEY